MKQMHLPTLEIPHKRCPNCGATKPWSAYSSRQVGEFHPVSYCRKCQRRYCKLHYRKNSDKHNRGRYQRRQTERKDNREFVWRYLETHPCIDCGECDIVVLEFDHVSGKKVSEVSILVSRSGSRRQIEEEMAKCVVRCANCHRRKTASQLGWKVAQRHYTEILGHGR
jgi:hypothetical protein